MKKMECQDYRELFPEKQKGDLTPEQEKLFNEHLSGCKECIREFDVFRKLWNLLGELPQPEPSEQLADSFNVALNNLTGEKNRNRNVFRRLMAQIAGTFTSPSFAKIAFSIFLLLIGIGMGYFLNSGGNMRTTENMQIDSLSSQVSELKEMIMLSMLQEQSASMRLQAVSYTEELNSVDKKVIDALLMTLNSDPNVNVRLATLEALVKLADEPLVREGLVRSIENQESPIVQSAIADVMVKLNEKSSVEPLKKLLSRKDLNQSVKINIEQSIQKLI